MTRKLQNLRKFIRGKVSYRNKADKPKIEVNKPEQKLPENTSIQKPVKSKIKTNQTPGKNLITEGVRKIHSGSKHISDNIIVERKRKDNDFSTGQSEGIPQINSNSNNIVVHIDSSYQGEDVATASSNILRAASNRTQNQLSILIKKRKARMANASSFASLSRFSQPNDSESSFRNAYNEYKQAQLKTYKRSGSPTTVINKSKDELIGSRNATYDIANTSKIESKHQHMLDNRDSYYNNKKNNMLMEPSQNSMSFIMGTDTNLRFRDHYDTSNITNQ